MADASSRQTCFQATKNYFSSLGVPVAPGRGWNEADPDDVVVLHPHFRQSRLNGDPAIIGKAIRLDGRLYTVLGILPENHRSLIGSGYTPDVFVPKYIEGTMLAAYGRMKPGMTLGQLNAALPALGQRLDREFPPQFGPLHATAVHGVARLRTDPEALVVTMFFASLLAAAGLVLIIACVNVANLLLAPASVRRREIAIRLALGAGRWRLLQQLLAESLLLSVAGAGLGFLFALGAPKAAAAIPLPFPLPIRLRNDPDWRVASYAAVLAVASAVASGLMPAWQSVKESLSAGMHRERKQRVRRILVVAQIAVSFVVLAAAALFFENLVRSHSMRPGFDIRRTLRAEIYLPPGTYQESRSNSYVRRTLEGLQAIPGVKSAAAARIVPFSDNHNFLSPINFSDTGEKVLARFSWNAVSPDYFRAMDIPVRKGRSFTERDDGSARVVIVNETFVRRYLGRREAVGATFEWGRNRFYRIVGVVSDTKTMTIGEGPVSQLYEPLAQTQNSQQIQFVVRTGPAPAGQLAAVRQALRRVEPAAGLKVETMFAAIGFAFLPSQVGAILMGSVGALGLLLSIVGLYGVLAYSVARRTYEIGIRLAVGATPGHVSQIVLSGFARLLTVGIGIGLAAALLITRPLAIFLVPGLSASDPLSLAGVVVVLSSAGVLAAIGPMRRALRVDPLQCLRYE